MFTNDIGLYKGLMICDLLGMSTAQVESVMFTIMIQWWHVFYRLYAIFWPKKAWPLS